MINDGHVVKHVERSIVYNLVCLLFRRCSVLWVIAIVCGSPSWLDVLESNDARSGHVWSALCCHFRRFAVGHVSARHVTPPY